MADLDVAVKLRLINGISKDAKIAAKDLAGVGKAADKLGGKATGKFAGELGKAWTASVKLGGALDKTAIAAGKGADGLKKIGAAGGALDATRRKVDQLTKSTTALGASATRVSLRDHLGRFVGGGRGGALAAGAAGVAVGRRSARRDALQEAASRMSSNGYLVGAGGAVIAGAAIGGTAAAAAGGMALAVREAIKFERAFADVKKKVDLDPGMTWADIESSLNKVSRELGMARGDTAALAATAGQAGIAPKDIVSFTRLAAKAAVAWDIGPKEAADQLAKIKAQTQWTIPQLEEFSDKINAIGDASASSEKNALEMFMRSAAAAKAANVPLDATLAATAALNSIGMQEEIAARFWNASVSKLRTATELPDKAQEGFKLLGLTAKDVERGMKKDAVKTILDVYQRLEKSPDKAKAAVKIFGQEWWDEAARAGQALQEIVRLLDLIASGTWKGSVDKNMQIDLATTENHLKRAGAMLSEIGDRLGRGTLPLINEQLEITLKKWAKLDEDGRRRETERAIVGKGVNDPLTPDEAKRLASDSELAARVARQRESERKELEAARFRRDKLAVQVSSARAAGSASLADVPAMTADLRKLDAQIAFLERRVEAVARQAEPPKERKEGLRGAFGRASQREVDALIGKLTALADASRALELFPKDGSLREQAAKLVADLEATFKKADLGPAARQVIETYAATIGSEGGKAAAQAQAIRAQLERILGAPITVKIEPRLSGARGIGGSTGSSGGGATPKKTSAIRPGGDVHIREAHFHGVQNFAALHRSVMAAADRQARARRDNALHDIDVG